MDGKIVLYLDIDGVLLRGAGESIWNGEWEVAPYAAAFLEWALENCQPVWLTARDIDGSGNGIAAAFARAKGGCAALSQLAMRIPSLQWTGLKTEAINYEANFLWLDDCPRPEDLLALERNGCVDRWIEVNTDVQPDALLRVIEIIRLKAGTHDASFQRNGRP